MACVRPLSWISWHLGQSWEGLRMGPPSLPLQWAWSESPVWRL